MAIKLLNISVNQPAIQRFIIAIVLHRHNDIIGDMSATVMLLDSYFRYEAVMEEITMIQYMPQPFGKLTFTTLESFKSNVKYSIDYIPPESK